MEIDRTISNVWTVTIHEGEVIERFIDETIHEGDRRRAANAPALVASDDDKSNLHRYYCTALAELSALLARRTRRVGGRIENTSEPESRMITTIYYMPMTCNHEDGLLAPLGAHCLDFLVARLMELWYGQGSNFGAEDKKTMIREVIHFRRFPIERPFRPL